MNKLLAALLALALAGQADAKALFLRSAPTGATQVTGLDRIGEAAQAVANTLGGDYVVKNLCDAPVGGTEAIRDGYWWPNGVGVGTPESYGLVVIIGDDKGNYGGAKTVSAAAGSGGFADIRSSTANAFAYMQPGMVCTGNAITGSAVVVGVDSIYQKLRVKGTVAYNASFTLTWGTPIRPDSLTRSVCYPRVPILRLAQFQSITGGLTTAATCSTGVTQTATYNAWEDSTRNVYDVGNHYRSWKARNWYCVSGTRDPRGYRALLGSSVTRAGDGTDLTNYDFPSASYTGITFSANPDTVAAWMIMNRDVVNGARLGGNSQPNIYAVVSQVNGTNVIDPGTLLFAFGIADSVSGGALFGSSTALPRQMAFHIDDGWKRGDSKYNVGGAYGGIGVTDTAAFKGSIDSLAALGIPVVVGVECDSLDSVLLSTGVTGNGRFYDQRWWARAPLVHYTPHCHAGLVAGTNRPQNIFGEAGKPFTGKFLRPLDLWGLSRTRYAFGSVDSLLAYGLTDYVNDVADSGATYWLSRRAKAMCDSVFGASKVDGLVMPPGDDWTNFQIKHTRLRQHGLGVDSVMAAAVMSGMKGIRMNASVNVFGNDDSTVTNNYGWWTSRRAMTLASAAGGNGLPSWTTAAYYGRPCNMVTTDGYPTNSSEDSWSVGRASSGGERFLNGLLMEHAVFGSDPTTKGRRVFVFASHCSDFGSSGPSGMQTRPGFYMFKYVTNAIRTANAHARKALVQFVYPEQVKP